jgi:tetratricopeptide (TPR) repeat protein
MGYPSAKMKARFVLLTMLLGSTLGAVNSSYRGGFFAYGDPSNYENYDGGATQELAGGMLVLCQYSLEYTRSVLSDLEGEDDVDLTAAWELLAKAEEQYLVAQIQMFEYQDYHATVQHSRRVLELCEGTVELISSDAGYGDVLGGGASDYDLAWGAIERACTLLNNLEDALSKLNDLDVSVIESILDDARDFIDLAELQLNTEELGSAEASVDEAMSLLEQAMDLLQQLSRDKKIDKVLTLVEAYEAQLRELEAKIVEALVMIEDYEELLAHVVDIFQDARDEIEQLKSQLDSLDINLVIDELEGIYHDVLGSLSSIGWLDDSDIPPMLFQEKLER